MFWLYLPLQLLCRHIARATSTVSHNGAFVSTPQCVPNTTLAPLSPYTYHAFKPSMKYTEHGSDNDVFELQRIVVIHRHGDRSQINKKLGLLFPFGRDIQLFWEQRMPSTTWENRLAKIATIELHDTIYNNNSCVEEAICPKHPTGLYVGEDKAKSPFGMLTQRGVNQLMHVGYKLHQKYRKFLFQDSIAEDVSLDPESIYARSTNYCRTHLSLRSLLLGLSGQVKFDDGTDNPLWDHDSRTSNAAPSMRIVTRAKSLETMFPAADNSCSALLHYTQLSYNPDSLHTTIVNYAEFTDQIESSLGVRFNGELFVRVETGSGLKSDIGEHEQPDDNSNNSNEKWDWADVKEVLTCHLEHESGRVPHALNMNVAVTKSTEIASRVWHDKYVDPSLNKYALGRFFHELIEDIPAGLGRQWNPGDSYRSDSVAAYNASSKKLLLYSGHDSTIVPLLHALGIHSVFWPPYATHVTIELAKRKKNGDDMELVVSGNDEQSNQDQSDFEEEDKAPNKDDSMWARVWFNDQILEIDKISTNVSYPDDVSKDSMSTGCPSSHQTPDIEEKDRGWFPFDLLMEKLKAAAISHDEYISSCRDMKQE